MSTITKIITLSILLLSTACLPLPDGGHSGTETLGDMSTSTTGSGLPEGLWGPCGAGRVCPRELSCVAGQELELGPDGEWVLGPSAEFCALGCSEEIPCPEGPDGQIATCLMFPSQPGVGWCYVGCDGQACPMGQTCMDLSYSLQIQGDQHYCV